MAIHPAPLWDFSNPAKSEERFRAALREAKGDDALILHTQIARTFGLRREFERARAILRDLEPGIHAAGARAQVHFHLEMGRTHASATHAANAVDAESRATARQAFAQALAKAQAANLDGLAIDAIHMLAFVDTQPLDQLKWGEAALKIALASSEADARRWEASLRNNIGYALHRLGRHDEALSQFQEALAIREREGKAEAVHVARWMVAWTLRSLARHDEAIEIQLALEKRAEAAGRPDPHVFAELAALFELKGDAARAGHYKARHDRALKEAASRR